jgi:hypothetical protein
MLHSPEFAGPTKTGLDFVCQQQDSILLGSLADPRPEIVRGYDASSLTLDGFHQDPSNPDTNLLADIQLSFDRFRISKWDMENRPSV